MPQSKVQILITVPRLDRTGGVANYYRTLRHFLTPNTLFFELGSHSYRSSPHANAIRHLTTVFFFAHVMLQHSPSVVVLNPSLGWRSIVRDGILHIICKTTRTPTIVFFRGWDLEVEKELSSVSLWWLQKTLLASNAIIVLASHFKNRLEHWGYENPIHLETTMVGQPLLEHVANQPKKYFPTSTEDVHLLFMSRIETEKGIFELLEAFKNTQQTYPNTHLHVAGAGSQITQVQKYVKINDLINVHFAGYVRDKEKYELLSRCDIYLLPSYAEGMPNALLEAMAAGLACITTAVGGIPDFFEEGRMGFILPNPDAALLEDRIKTLITRRPLRQQIYTFNRLYAKDKFSTEQILYRFWNILQETQPSFKSESIGEFVALGNLHG